MGVRGRGWGGGWEGLIKTLYEVMGVGWGVGHSGRGGSGSTGNGDGEERNGNRRDLPLCSFFDFSVSSVIFTSI